MGNLTIPMTSSKTCAEGEIIQIIQEFHQMWDKWSHLDTPKGGEWTPEWSPRDLLFPATSQHAGEGVGKGRFFDGRGGGLDVVIYANKLNTHLPNLAPLVDI